MIVLMAAVVVLTSCAGIAVTIYSVIQAKKAVKWAAESRSAHGQPIAPGTPMTKLGTVKDIDGQEFSLPVGSNAPWVLAFLSSECPACKQQLSRLRKYLRNHGIAPERAVSVVTGDPARLDGMTVELAGASRLLRVEEASTLMTELYVSRWPTYVVVDSADRVAFSSNSVARLAAFGFGNR
ncbi:hypothetical protein ABTZ78_28690 [Streptomyces bauhiniae]|uniref:hypothetical protein n=1 Tax=Streptomyces bauhiniae TaxID=2340725 RepID=UPI00332C7B01